MYSSKSISVLGQEMKNGHSK